jgi:hypothetical protein
MMSNQILLKRFKESFFECLDETFEQVHGVYLDKGTTLFETLRGITAEEASHAIADNSATIAAQVEHVRFYLDVLVEIMRTKEIVKVDWKEIWQTVREVTPEEWETEKRRLEESYRRVLETINGLDNWEGEYDISGALSILVHTAYHLGGIRQALAAIKAKAAAKN